MFPVAWGTWGSHPLCKLLIDSPQRIPLCQHILQLLAHLQHIPLFQVSCDRDASSNPWIQLTTTGQDICILTGNVILNSHLCEAAGVLEVPSEGCSFLLCRSQAVCELYDCLSCNLARLALACLAIYVHVLRIPVIILPACVVALSDVDPLYTCAGGALLQQLQQIPICPCHVHMMGG